MARRIRSVHPDITEDETLAQVSASAERTFVRLWTYLDDDGRCRDNPRLIKAAIYPLHDNMTAHEVDADLWELLEHGMVLRYEVDGKTFLAAKTDAWSSYQKPQRKTASKLPAPPEDYEPPERPKRPAAEPTHEDHSATRQRDVRDTSATPPRVLPDVSHPEGRGVGEGEGGERERPTTRGALALVPATGAAPAAPVRTLRLPPSSALSSGYPQDFEAWYSLYPRKRNKADAAAAWPQARALATWEQLIEGLKRSIAVWEREKTPPDKIPHPATWLSKRRWEDEDDIALEQRTEVRAHASIRAALEARGSA